MNGPITIAEATTAELDSGLGHQSAISLRILMVLDLPWTKNLGAPRVSVELADEFRALGHLVEKFDVNDAFPRRGRIASFFNRAQFPARAARYIRARSNTFDVVFAEQGNVPYSKAAINFHGVLVARSNGLAHLYHAHERSLEAKYRRQGRRAGSFGGNMLRWFARQVDRGLIGVEDSFRHADAILANNPVERDFVSGVLLAGQKCHVVLDGLSSERSEELWRRAAPASKRLSSREVVFVGWWQERKGSNDFREIIRLVRVRVPGTRFRLLGTGQSESQIRQQLAPEDREAVSVVSYFRSEELPDLLAHATVGVFPSYLEGFGIAVLETLASGLPIVAYDIPGPREMLKFMPNGAMVPPGDVQALVNGLTAVLESPLEEYETLRMQARNVSLRFQWKEIAAQVISILRMSMLELRRAKPA